MRCGCPLALQLRVDYGRDMIHHVMPLMLKHNPSFARDIVLFNFG